MITYQKTNEEKINEILSRGVANIIPNRQELEKTLMSGRTLNVYLGIDPTSTKIHLGNAVPLRRLQLFVELGHKVTFLIGDFTALIGDTSDKESERPVLTYEQIEENFKTYREQAEKFLDFSKVKLVHNSDWLQSINFPGVIKLLRHFSLNDFISRELIKKRLSEGKSISLPEVIYPVMQGYDSYFLDTDIQIGGTDQVFNMQAGRTLQKNLRQKESFIIENEFLPGTDGRKMSKTWGNGIYLTDAPEDIYGKVMSITDEVIGTYFILATSLPMKEVEEFKKKLTGGENPMGIKKELARVIVTELYDEGAAKKAAEHFSTTVVSKQPAEDVAVVKLTNPKLLMDELIGFALENNLVESKSEFRRLLEQGGIYLNEVRVEKDVKELSLNSGENVVRFGKRKYLKLFV
ncbi:MAG: tyrosine--tRNA ligase [Microgenomates group bacterium]